MTFPPIVSVVVRWILVVPGSVASVLVAYALSKLLNRWSMAGFVNPDAWLTRVLVEGIASGIAGATFVYVATRIAPSHRRVVAGVATGAGLVLVGLMLFPAIVTKTPWAIYGGAAMAVGICSIGLNRQVLDGLVEAEG